MAARERCFITLKLLGWPIDPIPAKLVIARLLSVQELYETKNVSYQNDSYKHICEVLTKSVLV